MKFRIFDIEDKKFLSFEMMRDDGIAIFCDGAVVKFDSHVVKDGTLTTIKDVSDHLIAQQSTGFFHNGAEVWEGDIFSLVTAENEIKARTIGLVRFKKEYAVFVITDDDTAPAFAKFAYLLKALKEPEFEAKFLGNVLTHPKLWRDTV